MRNNRITPDEVVALKTNEVFVFGSNLQGMHAGGAALTARLFFGAILGQGEGLQGQQHFATVIHFTSLVTNPSPTSGISY